MPLGGKLKNLKEIDHSNLSGQYEDVELDGLYYYNRHRFYDSQTGLYISQDPIGLAGNNPNFYAYVYDPNIEIDLFGLDPIFANPLDINFSQTSINKNFDTPEGKINIDKFVKQVKGANLPDGGTP